MNIESEVLQINLDDIIPNRFQPRLAFDEQGLKELSDSIKEHGIIQPLVLRKLGNKYEIIAGERRYKAATQAGLVKVPAIISNIDDNKSAEVALVENLQRRDLSAIEEARSYKNLLDKGYLTQEQLAKKMGLSQSAIANKLRLLNLDESIQKALMENKISERHARTLLKVEDKSKQHLWLNKIVNERLTVRQLEQELKNDPTIGNAAQPIIDNLPSFEDIKNNARDIRDDKPKRSVESMMMPEDTMTEFSGSLPTDVQINEKKVIENKVEEVQPAENKFFNFAESETANLDTGINVGNSETSVFKVATNNIDTLDSTISAKAPIEHETLDFALPTSNPTQTDAKNEIMSLVDTLKSQGQKIFVNEYDLGKQVQISILIEK